MDRVDDDGNINDDDGPYSGSTITPPTPSKHTMATTLFDDLNCVVSIEPIHVLEKEDDEGGDDGCSDSIVESGQKRHRRTTTMMMVTMMIRRIMISSKEVNTYNNKAIRHSSREVSINLHIMGISHIVIV